MTPSDKSMFNMLRVATKYGHLNIIQWAFSNTKNINIKVICNLAARHGHLNILKWIESDDDMFPRSAVHPSIAAKRISHRHKFSWNIYSEAIISGNLEMMIWLYELGYKLYSTLYYSAARHGHWKIISWLYENKCKWLDQSIPNKSDVIVSLAISSGESANLRLAYKVTQVFSDTHYNQAILTDNSKIIEEAKRIIQVHR